MTIYLDNAATTPLLPEVKEEMKYVIDNHYGNPSSIHKLGRTAKTLIEKARKTISSAITCSVGEIFFTSCATESNNMILHQCISNLDVTRIITSPIEHHCILHTLEHLTKHNPLIEVVYVAIKPNGQIDYENLKALLTSSEKKTLVSLMHGNNEIGNLTDLKVVSQLCQESNALFHTDTAQTIGKEYINVQETHVDFLTGSAHKFHGPKGIGFVYIYGDHKLDPILHGGAQERNMRSGTENLICIVAMAKALEISLANREKWQAHMLLLKTEMKKMLVDTIEGIEFIGDQENSLNHVLSVSFPPSPHLDLLEVNLDMNGVYASAGSACSSGTLTASHVMDALNINPLRKTVRFSFSSLNTLEEIKEVVKRCGKICNKG